MLRSLAVAALAGVASLAIMAAPAAAQNSAVQGSYGINTPGGPQEFSDTEVVVNGILFRFPNHVIETVDVNGLPHPIGPLNPLPISFPANQFNADGGFNTHIANLGGANGAAEDGVDASGVTPPTGGAGIRGWLSGLFAKLSSAIAPPGTLASQALSVTPGCNVVAVEQTYTAGQVQPCTMTPTGRIKVGLSSAALNGAAASGSNDAAGGVDPAGNQQSLQVDVNKNLKVADISVVGAITGAGLTPAQLGMGPDFQAPSGSPFSFSALNATTGFLPMPPTSKEVIVSVSGSFSGTISPYVNARGDGTSTQTTRCLAYGLSAVPAYTTISTSGTYICDAPAPIEFVATAWTSGTATFSVRYSARQDFAGSGAVYPQAPSGFGPGLSYIAGTGTPYVIGGANVYGYDVVENSSTAGYVAVLNGNITLSDGLAITPVFCKAYAAGAQSPQPIVFAWPIYMPSTASTLVSTTSCTTYHQVVAVSLTEFYK